MGRARAAAIWVLASLAFGFATAVAQPASAPSPATPLSASPSVGSSAPSPATAPQAPTPPPCCLLPAGTPVRIRLAEPLSSKRAHPGDSFAIELAEDIMVGDRVVAPHGGVGHGEVIDAAAAGMAGRAGKLVLAAREVKVGGVRLPLRGFHLSDSGRNESSTATIAGATPYIGAVLAFAITGGNIEYPEGVRASAKLAADVFVAVAAPATPAPLPIAPATAAPLAPPPTDPAAAAHAPTERE